MWNGTMFVDLDWPLNASSLLSASAELLVCDCFGCLSFFLSFTLRASCGAVYCTRSCLWVCVFVCVWGLLPRKLEIACIDLHQTGFVGKGPLNVSTIWSGCSHSSIGRDFSWPTSRIQLRYTRSAASPKSGLLGNYAMNFSHRILSPASAL